MSKRTLYHMHGCRYITIGRNEKSRCSQCSGNGFDRKQDECRYCNGHGWLWGSNGYCFKPYTLESVYN